MADEYIDQLPALPSPVAAGDLFIVERASVEYKADATDLPTGSGTVTSVALSVPAFLTVAGSPVTTSGTLAVTLSGTALPVANGGTGITAFGTGVATGLGVNVGSAGAFVVNGGALGTPSSGVATNLTGTAAGLTAGTASAVAVGGITGLGTGVATALAINVGSAGAPLVNGGALGTPSSGTATNLTGTAAGLTVGAAAVAASVDLSGITGLGTGVGTALGINVGSAGAPVTNGGALGTPSSGVATNLTGTAAGLTAGTASAVAVGGITGLGTGVATALAVNVGSAGAPVVNGGALGTPSSGTLTNATGLPPAGLTTAAKTFSMGFTAAGFAAGKVKGYMPVLQTGTLVAWHMGADAGTPVVKVWKIASGTAVPTAANSINTSGVGLASGTYVRSTTLTDFGANTTFTSGDIVAFNVESASSATEMSFLLELTKN